MREIDVQEAIGEGKSRKEIFEIFSKKWGITEKSVENIYYKVVNGMKELVMEGREELRAKLMARNDLIYQKALRTGKLKTALDANLAQARIAGVNEKREDTKQESKKIVITEREPAPIKLVGDKAENE